MTPELKALIKRGDVWLINFDPSTGAEIQKTRPAAIVSMDGVGRLPLKVVVPITDWKEHYGETSWLVKLSPSTANGLTKESAADAFQIKSVSLDRFVRRIGVLSAAEIREIADAIAVMSGYEP